MNIDKINGIMLRAIHLFEAGEVESLHGEDDLALEGLEVPIAQMAKEIAEEIGEDFEKVLDTVTGVLGEAAAQRFGAEGLTEETAEEKLAEWMSSGGATPLAQRVVEQLQAA